MREKILKVSVFAKLIFLVLAIIVTATTVIGTVSYKISASALKKSVSRHLDSISSELANTIESMNEKEFTLIESLAKLDVMCDESVSLAEKSEILAAVRKRLGSRYQNLAFYAKNGDAIMADGSVRNFAGAVYLEAALRGERFISEPLFIELTNSVLQNYCVPVFDNNHNPIGAIVLIINGNGILDTIKNIGRRNSSICNKQV